MNTLLKIIQKVQCTPLLVALCLKMTPDFKMSCTINIYIKYLNLENSLPNMVCMGIRNMRTPIPAKHDGPISAHSKPTTIAA